MLIKNNKLNQKGSTALTAVIILTALLILGSAAVIYSVIDLSASTTSYESWLDMKIESTTCLEEGIKKIKYDINYTGTISFTSDNGNCQAIITNDGSDPDLKIITINTTSGEYQNSYIETVDVSLPPFI